MKKLLTSLLAGAMLFGLAVPALAASTPYNQQADVTFQQPTTGALKIDGAAPDLKFGTRTIELKDKFYPETTGSDIVIKIDGVRCPGVGCQFQATLYGFVGVTTATDTLSGAKITLRHGVVTQDPSAGAGAAPVASSPVVLTATGGGGTAQQVMVANGSLSTPAGMFESVLTWTALTGASTTDYDTQSDADTAATTIYLSVPLSAAPKAQQYKSQLVWDLIDAP